MLEPVQGEFSFEEDKCTQMITVIPLTKRQEREREYLKNPLICQCCNTIITYDKFIKRKYEREKKLNYMACCSNKCRTDLYKKRLTKTIYKKQEREEEYLKNPLICQSCNTSLTYKQSIQWNKTAKRKNPERTIACSHGCSRKNIHKAKGVKKELEYLKNPLVCECCENTLTYKQSIRRKSTQRENPDSKIFCSTLCSRRFASKITRPKVEILCEEKINSLYKNYGFIFNNIETIKYELDIYSPVLKLAIELNGPTHYKDIFSNPKKFQRRLEIDKEKKILCKKLGIELVSLDISKRTKNYNQDILDRVIKVIEERVQKCGDALI